MAAQDKTLAAADMRSCLQRFTLKMSSPHNPSFTRQATRRASEGRLQQKLQLFFNYNMTQKSIYFFEIPMGKFYENFTRTIVCLRINTNFCNPLGSG